MMRHPALIFLAFLWVAPAQAETKKAPDGFGPIKFGMTKEQAWAAIGGKGEWADDGELVYELPIVGLLDRPFEVRQSFRNGRASAIVVSNTDEDSSPHSCLDEITLLVGLISAIYDRVPLKPKKIVKDSSVFFSTRYFFVFNNGIFIDIDQVLLVESGEGPSTCYLNIYYSPPLPSELLDKAIHEVF